MSGPSISSESALEKLSNARQVIRSQTRSSKYWAAGDGFSEMFLGRPLGAPLDIAKAAGSDLAAVLDTLYEEFAKGAGTPGKVRELTRALQAATEPRGATEALARFDTAFAASKATVEEAAETICAVLTLRGYEELSRRAGTEAADDWLALWREMLWKHNSQQEAISVLGMLAAPPADKHKTLLESLGSSADNKMDTEVPTATTFTGGVREFLAKYGETGGSNMSLLGAFAFSQTLAPEELRGLLRFMKSEPEFLGLMVKVLRFAQDVNFDPTEVLNTGIFAHAAERRARIVEVIASRDLSNEFDRKLKEAWAEYGTEAQNRLAEILQKHSALPGHKVLSTLLMTLMKLTQMLIPGSWKTGA